VVIRCLLEEMPQASEDPNPGGMKDFAVDPLDSVAELVREELEYGRRRREGLSPRNSKTGDSGEYQAS